jgi:glutathione S-transferase
MVRVIAAGERRSRRAAAERLPSSTVTMKALMASIRSNYFTFRKNDLRNIAILSVCANPYFAGEGTARPAVLPIPRGDHAMKLYDFGLSGHSHRARLFLSLIGADPELVTVDLAAAAHRRPDYLALNRFGEVPVLDDDGVIVQDSNAILVYLAKKFQRTDWLPEDPEGAAKVQRWLSIAAGKVAFGPAVARLVTVFGAQRNAEEAIARSHDLLKVMDAELGGNTWITGSLKPTIADVALYSYIARAPEGRVDLAPYANVNAWLRRIEALPGFVAFQKTPVGLEAPVGVEA